MGCLWRWHRAAQRVENGFFRSEAYFSYANTDYTVTERITRILSGDFVEYLERYFVGWQLLQRVETHPYPNRPDNYKIVYFALDLDTDADAITVASHLRKAAYPFDFWYHRNHGKP